MQIRRLEWDVDAWEDYMYWHMQDKKTLKRINELIKDMLRHPFDGKGKPEPLKRNLHDGRYFPLWEDCFQFLIVVE